MRCQASAKRSDQHKTGYASTTPTAQSFFQGSLVNHALPERWQKLPLDMNLFRPNSSRRCSIIYLENHLVLLPTPTISCIEQESNLFIRMKKGRVCAVSLVSGEEMRRQMNQLFIARVSRYYYCFSRSPARRETCPYRSISSSH